MQATAAITTVSARERAPGLWLCNVAGFLLAFSRRNERNGKDPSTIELPMTRTDIGDFLGLTIETVSRTFSKFKAMAVIELPQSNEVKVIDLEALERLAAGDNDHQ